MTVQHHCGDITLKSKAWIYEFCSYEVLHYMKGAVFGLDTINKCSSIILDKKVRYIGNKDRPLVE